MDRDEAAALAEFRSLNPWFHSLPDEEARGALVLGSGPVCRARIETLGERLGLALPVVDASGMSAGRARALLEALAPGDLRR